MMIHRKMNATCFLLNINLSEVKETKILNITAFKRYILAIIFSGLLFLDVDMCDAGTQNQS